MLTLVLALWASLPPAVVDVLAAVVIPLAVLVWTLPLPLILQAVLAVVLPILVGLVTTRVTSGGKKAVLLLALSAATSFATELLEALTRNEPFDVGLWLLKALGTFAVGVTTHYGILKPTGITAAVQAVGAKGGVSSDPDSPIPGTSGTINVHGLEDEEADVLGDRAARRRAAREAAHRDGNRTP